MANAFKNNFDALVATTDADVSIVTLSTGAVALRGATPMEVIVLSRDFKTLRDLLLGGDDDIPESDPAKAEEDPKIKAEWEAWEKKRNKALMTALIEEGPEAVASLIAVCANQKKKREAVVEALIEKPADELEALLKASIERTMPKGFKDFFDRVKRLMAILQGTDQQPANEEVSAAA